MKKNFFLILSFLAILIWSASASNYSQELQDAYQFAYKNGITTMDSIDKADMNWWLTRVAMAKMLSQYAINILWKTPDKSKTITFPDVSSKLDNDYNNWVTLAYQLWIMWIWIDKFRPFDSVTRAEFGTALSRVLYEDTYNQNWDNYYSKHLNALKNAWIMTKIDTPFQKEIRGYVMLMLMRSNWTWNINCNDPITLVECALNGWNCPCRKEKNNELTGDESLNESSNLIEKNIKLTAYSSKDGKNDIITKNTWIIKRVREWTNKLALDYVNIKWLDEEWFENWSIIYVTLKANTNIDYDYNDIKEIYYESEYYWKLLAHDSIPITDYLFDKKTQLIKIPVKLWYASEAYWNSRYEERSILFSVKLKEFEPYDWKTISFEIVDIKQPYKIKDNLIEDSSEIHAKIDKSSYYPWIYAIPAYIPWELYIYYKWENQEYDYKDYYLNNNSHFANNRWFDLWEIYIDKEGVGENPKLKWVIISTDSNIDLWQYVNDIRINKKESDNSLWKIENNKIIIDYPKNDKNYISPTINFKREFYNWGKEIHFFIADRSDLNLWEGSGFIRRISLDWPTIRTYSSIDSQSNNNSTGVDNSTGNSQSGNTQTNNENTNTQQDNTSQDNIIQNDENNNEDSNWESSSNSDSDSNCVDIEVDDWNSYNFCIVKWKSNGSKYSVKVDNAKDLSLCTVWKGGQNYDFYDCEWDISSMWSSWISQLRLSIKYNNKTYSKKVDYDLTNWVFVEN